MVKTPEEYASKELNKSLGKAIAKRELEIKKYEAKIKKIKKEIAKIKNGELVPEDDSSSSISSYDTIVNFILDSSGSMNDQIDKTISGFNEYVENLQKEKCKVSLTLTTFNDKVNIIYKNKPIKNVEKLTKENYETFGTTALYDAIGLTIQKLGKIKDNEKALFIILTDGYENASKEFNLKSIKSLIKNKEEEGYTFVFLGGDLNAEKEGGTIGINIANIKSFDKRNIGVVMGGLSKNTINYAQSSNKMTANFFK